MLWFDEFIKIFLLVTPVLKWMKYYNMSLKSLNDVVGFLISKYEGIENRDSIKSKVKTSISGVHAFPDGVVDVINQCIGSVNPPDSPPDWLAEIDKILVKENDDHKTLVIIEILTPLLYFDQLVSLKCFRISIVQRFELAWFSRLDIPRDLTEFQRLYEKIISMSEPAGFMKAVLPEFASQPFVEQMLFAALMMKESEKESLEWEYQFELVKTCPEYLIKYPNLNDMKGSYRPAFWMAHFVSDILFREVLEKRSSDSYRKCLKDVIDYEQKQEKASKDLESNDSDQGSCDFEDKIPEGQEELGKLLISFDLLLKEKYPQVFNKLRDGVSKGVIHSLNKQLAPLRIPKDLETLYLWHDGVEDGGVLFGFPEFLPLSYALQEYRNANELGEDFLWSKAWFTVAYESRVYNLVPLSESIQFNSKLIYHDIEGGDLEIHHHSIKNMLQTYMDAFSGGLYSSEDDYPEFDDEELTKIRLKHSPGAYSDDNPDAAIEFYETDQWPEEWKKYKIGSEDV